MGGPVESNCLPCGCRAVFVDGVLHVYPCANPQHAAMLGATARDLGDRLDLLGLAIEVEEEDR